MATVYLPLIQAKDFETFRAMLGADLPDAYDDWRNLVADRSHNVARGGHVARGIEVNPDEFAVWLTAHGTDRSAKGLDNFAFFKGSAIERE
jgi:hypothetical protein